MDKIDLRDLRIDNWIYHKDCPIPLQVSGVKDDEVYLKHSFAHNRTVGFVRQDRPSVCNIDEIKPIPLTKEILEKNFEVTYNGSRIYEESDCRFYLIPLSDGKSVPAFLSPGNGIPFLKIADVHYVRCYYVHQLQNILRDLGIDKEIIL